MKNKTPGAMGMLLTAAAYAGAALPAQAQDTTATTPTMTPATMAATPAADSDETPWQFGVSVPLWAPGIDGNVTVRGVQQNVNVSFDQLKDHLDASFALGLDARKGKLGFYTGVGYMKFSGDYSSANGAEANSELKFLVADAGVSYQLIKTESEHPFVLEATAGIRYWHTESDLTITGPGGLVSLSGGNRNDIVDPVIGLRASQYLTRKLHLDVAGDGGGFDISRDTDITWSATGVVTYDFAKWFSLSAGYKALALNESSGSGSGKKGVDLIFNGALLVAKFTF
jgi:hypothetical protein